MPQWAQEDWQGIDVAKMLGGRRGVIDATTPGIVLVIVDAFTSLSFEIYDGPEISSELYDFDSLNFPADQTTASLDRPSFIDDPRVTLAVGKVGGRIVAGAIAVTEGPGSYISFVAADKEARRHGLGDAVTRLVTRSGFDAGASMASLEASPFGYHVYERMGFREIFQYALLVVMPPKT